VAAAQPREGLDAYEVVLYRQDQGSWVVEVPAIPGCYAPMAVREEVSAELGHLGSERIVREVLGGLSADDQICSGDFEATVA
jgi:hypothetical protein